MTKTHKVICHGKTISRHMDFYHAQEAITEHFRTRKIDNSYEIIPIEFNSYQDYLKSMEKDND